MFQKLILTNKTNVFLVPQKDAQSVTVLVMYPVGSRYESDQMAGVSHFVEHLMFKGTKKRPNTLVLTREIDRLGAEYNAFTAKEYTGYYIKTDKRFLDTSLDILSDMLFNSKYEEKEMKREKNVIVEEIRMYNDNPLMHIENLFEELFYLGDLGRDVAGSEKTVLSYKREDVLKFRDRYYQPQNMTVVVAGKIDSETKELIEKYFASQSKINNQRINNKFSAGRLGKEKIIVQNKKTDQAQMMLGFPGFDYNSEFNPALAVLNTIFGGSMSSRLFIQIRERRGLAYMIRSGSEQFRDTGYVSIRAGLEAKNINKALAVIQEEIGKMIAKGATARELQDAKTHIRGSLSLSMEDSSVQANWYARQALFMKEIKTPEEKLAEIDQVTNEQIKALAKKVFDWDELRVAVIGDITADKIVF